MYQPNLFLARVCPCHRKSVLGFQKISAGLMAPTPCRLTNSTQCNPICLKTEKSHSISGCLLSLDCKRSCFTCLVSSGVFFLTIAQVKWLHDRHHTDVVQGHVLSVCDTFRYRLAALDNDRQRSRSCRQRQTGKSHLTHCEHLRNKCFFNIETTARVRSPICAALSTRRVLCWYQARDSAPGCFCRISVSSFSIWPMEWDNCTC